MCFIMKMTVNRQIWSSVFLQILPIEWVKMVVFIDDYSFKVCSDRHGKSGVLG